MKLTNIRENPSTALDHCERRVNNGSRSNFTELFLPKRIGNPFTYKKFPISILRCSSERLTVFGELPDFCLTLYKNKEIFVHPDLNLYYEDYDIAQGKFDVSPTSSSRTVKVLLQPYYLKLCYPDRIGRVTRELDERHIYSSMDVSVRFDHLSLNESVSDKSAFMPERGGMLFCDKDTRIGFVVRQQTPIGKNVRNISYLIPGFSLFSTDRDESAGKTLLTQLIKAHNSGEGEEYLLEQFCYPLVDIFFNCVIFEGIIPELHSQNVIFGFDEQWNVQSIIIRDLESHDKDISLMESISLLDKPKSYPFKCIDESQYNYAIKHSFMFDHKLGEYLIAELIKIATKEISDDFEKICERVKDYALTKYGKFIRSSNFFPSDGKWYKFQNAVVDRTQKTHPYAILAPLFR